MSYKIDILLSTYNGEKYLAEQLESIIAQDFTTWHLIIRDDGSNDQSVNIINDYVTKHPSKITLLSDTTKRLGPAYSFSYLLQKSNAPYAAFCDQDDVWLPDKLKKEMQYMLDTEKKYPVDLPLLIHSDLRVVNETLSSISNSFWDYQYIAPENINRLEKLLVQNYVTGCSVLINRKLIELAMPIPHGVIMHDWWLALIAMTKGEIINLSEATVLYRQHDKNDTGAKHWGFRQIVDMIIKGPEKIRLNLLKTRHQALALLGSGILDENQKTIVMKYVNMFELNWFARRWVMLRYGFTKHGILRNMAMFLVL